MDKQLLLRFPLLLQSYSDLTSINTLSLMNLGIINW